MHYCLLGMQTEGDTQAMWHDPVHGAILDAVHVYT